MQSLKKQAGASFLVWMVLIGILGFAAVMGLRLFPIYMESYTVGKILEDVALNSVNKSRNRNQLWSTIEKRLNINSVNNVKREHFSFKREKGKTTISIKYEVRTKLMGNLDGVATFEQMQTFDS